MLVKHSPLYINYSSKRNSTCMLPSLHNTKKQIVKCVNICKYFNYFILLLYFSYLLITIFCLLLFTCLFCLSSWLYVFKANKSSRRNLENKKNITALPSCRLCTSQTNWVVKPWLPGIKKAQHRCRDIEAVMFICVLYGMTIVRVKQPKQMSVYSLLPKLLSGDFLACKTAFLNKTNSFCTTH